MFLRRENQFVILLIFLFGLFPFALQAGGLYEVRDLIGSSIPATSTNHLLDFIVPQSVPPGGRIEIDFDPGSVNMPGSFDVADIDFAVATSGNYYIDRDVAAVASGTFDGASFITGTSASISIELNPFFGLDAGDKVRLELGNNASFGANGSDRLLNPSQNGVYGLSIGTYDFLNAPLDRARTLIVMIDPIDVTSNMSKIRANGIPDGVLAPGTIMTIMSLTTNYRSFCRYSTGTPIAYLDMDTQFNTTDNAYHTIILNGLIPGRFYTYYVRCFDLDNFVADTDDYIIDFSIAVSGEGGTGGGTGGGEGTGTGPGTGGGSGNSGTGSGGGSGGGSGARSGSKFPYPLDEEIPPDLRLFGWAYPSSVATILKDGAVFKEVSTISDGQFRADFYDLTKGLYTIGAWVSDPAGKKSPAYSSTFWIEENTQTNVANVLIPPTVSLVAPSVKKGEVFDIFGYSTPGRKVEVEIYQSVPRFSAVRQTDVLNNGTWRILFPTDDLAEGQYKLKAKTIFGDLGSSVWGNVLDCGVGESAEGDNCSRSDINKDGKVNLVDFSIMLFNWETTNAGSDINKDGKVNLVDFSIMLFCWTG